MGASYSHRTASGSVKVANKGQDYQFLHRRHLYERRFGPSSTVRQGREHPTSARPLSAVISRTVFPSLLARHVAMGYRGGR